MKKYLNNQEHIYIGNHLNPLVESIYHFYNHDADMVMSEDITWLPLVLSHRIFQHNHHCIYTYSHLLHQRKVHHSEEHNKNCE